LEVRCRNELRSQAGPFARLELVLDHIAQVEAGLAPNHTANAEEPTAMLLEKLTCVGRETAVVLSRGVFCRDFRDRRSLAAFAGLTPRPYSSRLQHDQGISKAGNSIVHARLVQLAWRWVRFRNGSDITAWFIQWTGSESRRSRRVAIVAVARKLLVAFWRYATQGLVPSGARLKPTAAG
jgi:transposase